MNIIDSSYSRFDSLFVDYYARLCAYAESFVENSQTSEDLVQDVFVNVWIKKEELTFNKELKPYLFRAVHNACLKYLRQQRMTGPGCYRIESKISEAGLIPSALFLYPDDPAQRAEIQKLYLQALDSLSHKTRTIFLLSREMGMKNTEIAEEMNLSVKAVEYHISNALKVFRIIMKDYYILLFLLEFYMYNGI